ncbi:hypothetical protein LCGC14_0336990 [marine sediment metagenome]|uniref:Uncharacterized protein n=1 Tax=marine sediment metagenome TaxID=412755 RepID=A0A0F9TXJ4_9ZZZZ
MALPQKGVAYDFYVTLVSFADPSVFQTNPTLATGDFKVSKDGGAFNNLATLPVVTPSGDKAVKVSLSATEMTTAKIAVLWIDVAGNEWQEGAYIFDVPIENVDTLPTIDDIWDEQTSEHRDMGSYGAELATKADIASASSTEQSTAISGVINEGDNDSGSYTDAASRDGIYWQIGEDETTGLDVEFTFNLSSTDHRPAEFGVFGRYIGTPPTQHHLELYAYNYESVSWELINDAFMPGGNTSDSFYFHEYYERHIDRDNDNEVKMRIVHHVTTYNASHALYLDYVELSSIEIITAADIADAVATHPETATITVLNSRDPNVNG